MLLVVKGVLDQFAILSLAGAKSWWLACFSTGLISTHLCSAGLRAALSC